MIYIIIITNISIFIISYFLPCSHSFRNTLPQPLLYCNNKPSIVHMLKYRNNKILYQYGHYKECSTHYVNVYNTRDSKYIITEIRYIVHYKDQDHFIIIVDHEIQGDLVNSHYNLLVHKDKMLEHYMNILNYFVKHPDDTISVKIYYYIGKSKLGKWIRIIDQIICI